MALVEFSALSEMSNEDLRRYQSVLEETIEVLNRESDESENHFMQLNIIEWYLEKIDRLLESQ